MEHLLGIADAATQDKDRRQARQAGRDVYDRAAREIERLKVTAEDADSRLPGVVEDVLCPRTKGVHPVPVLRPDAMRQRTIDERDPQDQKEAVRFEADALRHGTTDERRRDDREHPLEHHMEIDRDMRIRQQVGRFDAAEEDQAAAETKQTFLVAERYPRVAERKGIADREPVNADERQTDHALHHGREDVLTTDHAAVEQRQAGNHQEDQRAGNQHPGTVTLNERGLRRLTRFLGNILGCGFLSGRRAHPGQPECGRRAKENDVPFQRKASKCAVSRQAVRIRSLSRGAESRFACCEQVVYQWRILAII